MSLSKVQYKKYIQPIYIYLYIYYKQSHILLIKSNKKTHISRRENILPSAVEYKKRNNKKYKYKTKQKLHVIAFFCGVFVKIRWRCKVSDSDSSFWISGFPLGLGLGQAQQKIAKNSFVSLVAHARLPTILRTNPCWIIIYTLKFGGYNAARSIRCKYLPSMWLNSVCLFRRMITIIMIKCQWVLILREALSNFDKTLTIFLGLVWPAHVFIGGFSWKYLYEW